MCLFALHDYTSISEKLLLPWLIEFRVRDFFFFFFVGVSMGVIRMMDSKGEEKGTFRMMVVFW